MSENGHHNGESESMKAARSAPPLPAGRGEERVDEPKTFSSSAWTMALPLVVSVAGAVASGMAAKALPIGRDDHDDDDDGWFDSMRGSLGGAGAAALGTGSALAGGAKAAGVAGLLKAIGTGRLSAGAATAAKTLVMKKVADYVTDGAASAGRIAKRHPATTAAGAAAAYKARSAAQTGYGRTRDAALVLRHGRGAVTESTSTASALATGLTLLGIGAAAIYLFDPDHGPERRKSLRDGVIGGGERISRHIPGVGDAADSESGSN